MSKVVIDWGTSCFRAYLLDDEGQLQQEISEGLGAADLNKKVVGDQREEVFSSYLKQQLGSWDYDRSNTVHLLIGMVGSSIGWQNVPAIQCPTAFTKDVLMPINFEYPAYIVRGLACKNSWGNPDFMRGEEAQIYGLLSRNTDKSRDKHLVCLPGTHCKWAFIDNEQIQHFHTALTGEAYQLLVQHSILAGDKQDFDQDEFINGLEAAKNSPAILHQLFSCRARVLSGELASGSSHSFLSGLLLTSEVISLFEHQLDAQILPLTIIGSDRLSELYRQVIETIYPTMKVELYSAKQSLLQFANSVEF